MAVTPEILTEASLSNAYKQSIEKIKQGLIDQGLTQREATYLVNFYTELKLRNLFNSKYFKDFEYDGELINFSDIGVFVKDPELFYDVVMEVYHSNKFLEAFDIAVEEADEELKVSFNAKKLKKAGNTGNFTTYLDKYKVAEDDNWVSYALPTHKIAVQASEFYSKLYDIAETNRSLFKPTWCVTSSTRSYFTSQKVKKETDVWIVTFSKKPADVLLDEINKDIKAGRSRASAANSRLGEIYLKNNVGPTIYISGGNYGHHNWSNSPGTAIPDSLLEPRKTYNYEDLKIDVEGITGGFLIEGNVLKRVYEDEPVVEVPHGVKVIAEGAFTSELKRVVTIKLPMTTTIIENGAIKNLPNLEVVSATNNLEIVENGAIAPIYKRDFPVLVGVIEYDGHTIVGLNKPAKLRYLQRDLKVAYRKLTEAGEEDEQ